jgi:hypothetical protein
MPDNIDFIEPKEVSQIFAEIEAAKESFHRALSDFRKIPIAAVTHQQFITLNASIRALPPSLRVGAVDTILETIRLGHVSLADLPEEDVRWVLSRIKKNWIRIIEKGIENVSVVELLEDAENGFEERRRALERALQDKAKSRETITKAVTGALEALTGAGLVSYDVMSMIVDRDPSRTTSVFAGLTLFWAGVRR